MKDRAVNELINISLDSLLKMVDSTKIIGGKIEIANNKYVIPIAKINFGYGVGASEFSNKRKKIINEESGSEMFPFGGGSGGGIAIQPASFLLIDNDDIKIINANEEPNITDKIIEIVKELINK